MIKKVVLIVCIITILGSPSIGRAASFGNIAETQEGFGKLSIGVEYDSTSNGGQIYSTNIAPPFAIPYTTDGVTYTKIAMFYGGSGPNQYVAYGTDSNFIMAVTLS